MTEANTAAITMYATRFCPYCEAARNLFDELDVAYQEFAVDNDPQLRAEMASKSGRRTVPQIWIGKQHIGGFTELRALQQNGSLAQLLNS